MHEITTKTAIYFTTHYFRVTSIKSMFSLSRRSPWRDLRLIAVLRGTGSICGSVVSDEVFVASAQVA